MRDKISAGDKSLSRLLGEAPVVPMTTLKLVEELCNPANGADSSKSEHVTAGLTALWSLILQRPPTRDTCLKMALKVQPSRLSNSLLDFHSNVDF